MLTILLCLSAAGEKTAGNPLPASSRIVVDELRNSPRGGEQDQLAPNEPENSTLDSMEASGDRVSKNPEGNEESLEPITMPTDPEYHREQEQEQEQQQQEQEQEQQQQQQQQQQDLAQQQQQQELEQQQQKQELEQQQQQQELEQQQQQQELEQQQQHEQKHQKEQQQKQQQQQQQQQQQLQQEQKEQEQQQEQEDESLLDEEILNMVPTEVEGDEAKALKEEEEKKNIPLLPEISELPEAFFATRAAGGAAEEGEEFVCGRRTVMGDRAEVWIQSEGYPGGVPSGRE